MNRLLFIFFLAPSLQLLAQHQDPAWSARRAIINHACVQNDSLCNVLHQYGTFEGHMRNFFMATVNNNGFPDYYALATGGGLGYYSPIIKNFQVGLSGFIIYNLSSSHLSPAPPFTNRYEIGLFDVTNPDNHEDLDRLEDLYLRYYISEKNKSYFQVGKFHLKTPLINLQDGRMRPNLQEGLWFEWNEWRRIYLKGGLLWNTSPRGTIRWYNMGNSIGVYPNGRAVNGQRADYAGYVPTRKVWITQIGFKPITALTTELWNYHAEKLFNVALIKTEFKKKKDHHTWFGGIQYLWQRSVFNDTLALEKQYITRNEQSHSLSARIGKTFNRTGNEWQLNYTRITAHGRFLFPREWGIESFYTFLPRERTEGMGNVHALMLQNTCPIGKAHHLSVNTAAGAYLLPAVSEARLNKYALPSYYQLSFRLRYTFSGFLHGLQADVLYLYKGNLVTELEKSPAYFHNKVNMHHFSLMLDYYF